MNDWWKLALAGAAAAGLTVMTGGAAAPLMGGLMAGEGAAGAGAAAAAAGATEAAAAGTAAAGAAGAGAAGAGAAGAAGAGAAGAAGAGAAGVGAAGTEATAGLLATEGAGAAGAGGTATGATGGLLGGGSAAAPEASSALAYTTPSIFAEAPVAEGAMPAAYSDVAGEQFAAQNPSMWTQAQGYAGKAGKAASTYQGVSSAMGGGQPPPHQAPQGRPVYQGEAPQISQPIQQSQHPMDSQFAQFLLKQRQQRGMLG